MTVRRRFRKLLATVAIGAAVSCGGASSLWRSTFAESPSPTSRATRPPTSDRSPFENGAGPYRALICGHAQPSLDHDSAAGRLRDAFVAGGIESEQIGWAPTSDKGLLADLKSKLDSLRRAANPPADLIVVVSSSGGHDRGVDYLSVETNKSRATLQEIVDAIALTGIERCTLFVDVTSSPEQLDRFGSQPLKLPKGVWVACSRTGHRSSIAHRRTEGHHSPPNRPVTFLENASTAGGEAERGSVFLESLADALGGAADVNGDRAVRLFETAEFINDAFAARNLPTPRVHGLADADWQLTKLDESIAARYQLPVEQRAALTQSLLEQARRVLLTERSIGGVERLLRRAAAYATTEQDRREIRLMQFTLQAMQGDVGGALTQAKNLDGPLLIVSRREMPLQSGRSIEGKVKFGEVVEVIEQSGEWFRVGSIYVASPVGDELRLTRRPAPQAWFKATEAVSDPLRTSSGSSRSSAAAGGRQSSAVARGRGFTILSGDEDEEGEVVVWEDEDGDDENWEDEDSEGDWEVDD